MAKKYHISHQNLTTNMSESNSATVEVNENALGDFKIPKKSLSDTDDGDDKEPGEKCNLGQPDVPVLEQSYYNVAEPQSPSYGPQDEMAFNILRAMNECKEKPKVYNATSIMKRTVPDIEDTTLPRELLLKFQPLYCKLCEMHLTSNPMAKVHYKSKNHDKRVRSFLIEYAQQTGEPLHKRARLNAPREKPGKDTDPRYYYCEVCDLHLTGKMHAESHYMGKNHEKAVRGRGPPAGTGSYNSEGKWVRATPAAKILLKDGEDTFGLDFRRSKTSDSDVSKPTTSTSDGESTPKKPNDDPLRATTCTICNVVAPNPAQLEIHLQGQKHHKKLKQLALTKGVTIDGNPSSTATSSLTTCSICNVVALTHEQLEIHLKGQKHQKKLRNMEVYEDFQGADSSLNESPHIFSPNRTPSGQFYCKPCNLALNSEVQFTQHTQSKNHLKKCTEK